MLFAFVFVIFHIIQINGDIIVSTKNGQIRGTTIVSLNKTIHQFLGIRYGEPPVGELRFKKPKPVKSWSGIYNATNNGHSCMQKSSVWLNDLSEDCLFINVMSPVSSGNNLKPVMVWIHGGGLAVGSGILFPPLASYDVVLVGINYRLGPFGFLYGGSDDAPGNIGFWDMSLALKWVNDNIASFGGDPKMVTLFGESAGGQSIGHLITSPITRNMYKRAILESGASCYYTGKGITDKSVNIREAKRFANDLGCHDNQWLQCLKKVDAKVITDHYFNNGTGFYIDMPITGDEFMPETSQNALKSGHFKTGTEIMAGVMTNEGSSFAIYADPKLKDPNYHLSKDSIRKLINNLNNIFYKRLKPQIDTDSVYDFYISNVSETNQLQLRRAFSAIFGDFIITCPTHYFAKLHALWSDADTVYFYQFNHKGLTPISDCTHWMGVCHAEDVPFVFGLPFAETSLKYDDDDRALSRLVMHLWTTFAKTGSPLSRTVPIPKDIHLSGINLDTIEWIPFRDNRRMSIIPAPVVPKAMIIDPKNFGKMLNEPLKDNCDGLWKPYFL